MIKTTASSIKFEPGNYESRTTFQVVKKLMQESIKKADGTALTHASWQRDSNIIKFVPGEKHYLDAETLKIESIKQLIAKGLLVRVL